MERTKDGALRPADKKKRGTVIDGLLGFTDDGHVIHIPTGLEVCTPPDAAGAPRTDVLDDRKFILHMLDADPVGWAETRTYRFGEVLAAPLRERLRKTRDSYPGDPLTSKVA